MRKLKIVTTVLLGCIVLDHQIAMGACLKLAAARCYIGGLISTTSCAPGPGNSTVTDTDGWKNDCVIPSAGEWGYDQQQYYTGTCNWTRINKDCAGVLTYTPMSSPVQECTNHPNANSCRAAGGSD